MTDTPAVIAARVAAYLRHMHDAAEALAAPDPELAHERRIINDAQRDGA